MSTIKGENHIIRVLLYDVDGITVIPLADLTLLRVSVKQLQTVFATYTYGVDEELRDGILIGQFELEITKSLSAKFNSGKVMLDITMEKENNLFDKDIVQRDIAIINILTIDALC